MKTLHLSIIMILFVTGTGIAFAQSNNTQIQNGSRSTNSTCTDDMIQDMKTKYASFDEERAKTEAVNYESFKSEIKNDTYKFDAVSQEWTNDFAKCTVTFKNALVLFTVTDALGKERDVTVLVNPESYKPQSIDVKYDVPTHGGIITTVLSPLKQLEAGTNADQVKCNQGFKLIFKQENMSPICVKPDTSKILIERGWATPILGIAFQGHVINTVESECENEFKPKPFELKVLPNGTSITINYVPVFFMKPNSTGKICTNNWRISPEMNYSGKVITGIGKDDSITQDVTVMADPDTITMDSANKTIVYTITTSKDAVGFYRFSPMFSDCGGIPIAVGYDSTHSFDNDFPWLWETVPCPLSLANTEVTGLTGIDVAYITKEYR
jgi:hypothetical protein